MIEQKSMTFDHNFGYSFPLLYFLLKKGEEEKENELAKIVIKGNVFLLDQKIQLKTLLVLFT